MINKKILIATHNKGKLALIKELLCGLPYQIFSLNDLGITFDVPETGTTYEENAQLKAETYAKMSGLLTVADDGGIEVDALGGEPGVYSARYAGSNTTDTQKIDFLLEKMKNVPTEKRHAKLVAVLALARPGGKISFYRGILNGRITFEPKGIPRPHLPYRQIFIPDGFDKTLDELEDSNIVYTSHRSKAFEKLIQDLR